MQVVDRGLDVALMALLVGVLTLVVPEMDAVRGELLTLLITLSLAVIGGYSVEDAARTARSTVPGLTETDLRRLLRDVVIEVLDEMLPVGE